VERERERKSVKYCGTPPVVDTGEDDSRGSIPWAAKFIRPSAAARSSLVEAVGNTYSGSTLVAASDSSRWAMAAASPTFTARKRSGLSTIADVSRERMK
jgi:hypothetical protein